MNRYYIIIVENVQCMTFHNYCLNYNVIDEFDFFSIVFILYFTLGLIDTFIVLYILSF